jgi:alanine dehydrogenase
MKAKVGILRETKTPPDRRVAVTPLLAVEMKNKFPDIELKVQESDLRCFTDKEYTDSGINVYENISDCNILIGVKEVNIPNLIQDKTYLFFSHIAKKQPYNRELLREIVRKRITLIDYEYLTDENNFRIIAFGHWAGIVGAYNGLRAWGKRYNSFDLKPAHECYDMSEMLNELKKADLPAIKILVTGGGRVTYGALEALAPLNLRDVSPEEFLTETYNEPVFCRIDPDHYVRRKDGRTFDLQHFFDNPADYKSTFRPFTKVADLLILCHFWDPASPVFMTKDDMQSDDFSIKVIADVSCDIDGPVPSTIRVSTIAEPLYGYNPLTNEESEPFDKKSITVMAVDNLPGELPRDASEEFGKTLLDKILPSLLGEDKKGIIERATIAKDGKLTKKFAYLQNYLEGKE